MGEIVQYLCEECNKKFTTPVGKGKSAKKPIPEPKHCSDCGSKKLLRLRRVGDWE